MEFPGCRGGMSASGRQGGGRAARAAGAQGARAELRQARCRRARPTAMIDICHRSVNACDLQGSHTISVVSSRQRGTRKASTRRPRRPAPASTTANRLLHKRPGPRRALQARCVDGYARLGAGMRPGGPSVGQLPRPFSLLEADELVGGDAQYMRGCPVGATTCLKLLLSVIAKHYMISYTRAPIVLPSPGRTRLWSFAPCPSFPITRPVWRPWSSESPQTVPWLPPTKPSCRRQNDRVYGR